MRNGSGIKKPADLKGKKVGVPFVSTSHFHLLVALEQIWHINPSEVKILNMQPPQIVAAWERGDIDAAYVWHPALAELEEERQGARHVRAIGRQARQADLRRAGRRTRPGRRRTRTSWSKFAQGAGRGRRRLPRATARSGPPIRRRSRRSSKMIGGNARGRTPRRLTLLVFPTVAGAGLAAMARRRQRRRRAARADRTARTS